MDVTVSQAGTPEVLIRIDRVNTIIRDEDQSPKSIFANLQERAGWILLGVPHRIKKGIVEAKTLEDLLVERTSSKRNCVQRHDLKVAIVIHNRDDINMDGSIRITNIKRPQEERLLAIGTAQRL